MVVRLKGDVAMVEKPWRRVELIDEGEEETKRKQGEGSVGRRG